MRPLAAAAAAWLLPCARGEGLGAVALFQDSLRVSRAGSDAQASEWWIWGRHRRARQLAEAISPVRSFGIAESAEPAEEAPSTAQLQEVKPVMITPVEQRNVEVAPWTSELHVPKPAMTMPAELRTAEETPPIVELKATKPAMTMPAELRGMEEAPSTVELEERKPAMTMPAELRRVERSEEKEMGASSHTEVIRKVQKAILYKAGDRAQVLDTSGGPTNGSWVDCSITGLGSAPGTFNLFIAAAPPGQQDYSDVPQSYLRRAPGAEYYRYKVGDAMQLRIGKGKESDDQWVPCKITSRDKDEDTYRVHVPMAPPGKKDAGGIPAMALRPYDAAEYAKIEKRLDGDDVDFAQLMAKWHEFGAAEYAEGEAAEVEIADGPTKGEWVPCTILGKGNEKGTYRILVGGQEYPHAHVLSLRKAQPGAGIAQGIEEPDAKQDVQQEEVTLTMPPTPEPPHFEVGDVAEVLVKNGPNKGSWVQVSITGLGNRSNSYNIDAGTTKFENVPAATLRKGNASLAWDV